VKGYTAEGLIRLDHRSHRPGGDHIGDLLRQALQTGLRILNPLSVFP
jgi:hypothetical protein